MTKPQRSSKKSISKYLEYYTNLQDFETDHWIRLFNGLLQSDKLDRAQLFLQKISRNSNIEKTVIVSCFNALIVELCDLEAKVDAVLSFCDKFSKFDKPPARAVAYVLHCACNEPKASIRNDMVSRLVVLWVNDYGMSLDIVKSHGDVLSPSDVQLIDKVGT